MRTDLPTSSTFALHPDQDAARADAELLFVVIARELKVLLPMSAEIRHIGATAVPGCLTKGDLDIVVRVDAETFEAAERALAARFARNSGSKRTETFAAFEDGETAPHLGIQLTVRGGEDDYFHLLADALLRDPTLLAEYNSLKRRFAGQPMNLYREAKGRFVASVLARAEER